MLTNATGLRIDYDSDSRLTNFNSSAVVVVCDGDGHRVRKTVGGNTTLYLTEELNPTGSAQVLEELSATNVTPVRLYTYGLGLASQRTSGGTTHFHGYDGQASVRFLTDSSGNISDTYTFDAFGVGITNTGTTTNFYRYAGEQFDPDLGIYYLRARYLNQQQGRFISQDRLHGLGIKDPKQHAYLYAGADPVQNNDPDGWDSSEQIIVTGIQGGLAVQRTASTVRALNLVKKTACNISSGVYIFRSLKGGLQYVGQSKNILRRLQEQIRKGNLDPDQLENVLVALVDGPSQLERKIIEQLFINGLGGIRDPLTGTKNFAN